jgi:hypothetical protein
MLFTSVWCFLGGFFVDDRVRSQQPGGPHLSGLPAIHGHRRGQVDVNRSLFNSTGNGAPEVDPMGKWSPAAWGPLKVRHEKMKDDFKVTLRNIHQKKNPLIRIDCNDLTVTSLEWWLGEMAEMAWFDLFLGQWIIAIQTDFQHYSPATFGWFTGGWITIWSQSIQASPSVAAKHDETPHFCTQTPFFREKGKSMYLKILKVMIIP